MSEDSSAPQRIPSTKKLELLFLGSMAVVVTGAMLTYLKQELVPLIMAVLFCVFVQFLWNLVDDTLGRIVTLGGTALIAAVIINFVAAKVSSEYEQIDKFFPEYSGSVQQNLDKASDWVQKLELPRLIGNRVGADSSLVADSLSLADSTATQVAADTASHSPLGGLLRSSADQAIGLVPGVLSGILLFLRDILSSLAASLVYAAFILTELQLLSWKVHRAFPDKGNEIYASLQKVARGIADYFGVKTLISFFTALLTFAILTTAGVRFAFFWSVVTFFLNFIPNIGSLLALGLVSVAVLIDPVESKLLTVLSLGAVQFLFGNVIEPLVAGDTLDMSALAMLLSLALWYRIWGVSGALLSVPLTFAVKELCKLHPSLRFVTVFVEGQRNTDKLLKLKRRFWRFPGQYVRPKLMALWERCTRPLLKVRASVVPDRHLYPAPVLSQTGDFLQLSDGSTRIYLDKQLAGDEVVYRYLYCPAEGRNVVESLVYRSRQRLLLRRKAKGGHEIVFAFPIFHKGEQLRHASGAGRLETLEIDSGPGYAQFGARDLPEAWQATRYVWDGDDERQLELVLHEDIPWPLLSREGGEETHLVEGVVRGRRLFAHRRLLNPLWKSLRRRLSRVGGHGGERPQVAFPESSDFREQVRSGQWTVAFAALSNIDGFRVGHLYPLAGSAPATMWVKVEQVEQFGLDEVTRRTLAGSAFASADQLAEALDGPLLRLKFRFLGELPVHAEPRAPVA